jgi:hypothetical protein
MSLLDQALPKMALLIRIRAAMIIAPETSASDPA